MNDKNLHELTRSCTNLHAEKLIEEMAKVRMGGYVKSVIVAYIPNLKSKNGRRAKNDR